MMNNGGTLKRRRRRAIAKVTGLGIKPYNPKDDMPNWHSIYSNSVVHETRPLPPIVIRSRLDTRIRMSPLLLLTTQSFGEIRPGTRITRHPMFHSPVEDLEVSKPPKPASPDQNQSTTKKDAKPQTRDHPYFLDKTTMTRLQQIIILAVCSGTVPWRFNAKTHRIDTWSPKFEYLWQLQWLFVSVQTCLLTAFQFYSFITRVETEIGTYREVFMNSISLYWYICAVCFNVNMFLYKDQVIAHLRLTKYVIRHYINTLFRFNHEFVEKYLLQLDNYDYGGRLIMNLSIPSNTFQVFASVTLFLVIPYEPWYLFSYIYPRPWYWLIPGALQEFLVVGQVISNYILYQWIMAAHSISVRFWLQEIHNSNDSGYTKEEFRRPATSIETYRSLQVLTTCFNGCMSPLAVPLMKMHILTGLIPCGYVFIRSLNPKFIEEFPGILTYPVCVIDCAVAGFSSLTLAAQVHDLAGGFVESWSRTRQQGLRKVLISCGTLKVWVGRFYFVTVSTTVTFFKVATDYIIHCIITFP